MKRSAYFLFLLPLLVFFTFNNDAGSLFSNEILLFHHIPKNGGTTVTSLLDKQFAKRDICRF